MAKVQFSTIIKELDGSEAQRPIRNGPLGDDGKPKMYTVTIGEVVCEALNVVLPGEERLDMKEQGRRYDLIKMIQKAEATMTPLDLKAEDVVTLKDVVGRAGFPRFTAGQILTLLDPSAEETNAA